MIGKPGEEPASALAEHVEVAIPPGMIGKPVVLEADETCEFALRSLQG